MQNNNYMQGLNMHPAISVIVPVYNVEKYLHRCIDSILAQTFEDFELILVDDGSKDRSGGICDQYAEIDTRVRVFHQINTGVSAARNCGIEVASGKYLAFIDSDDYIDKNFFLKAYESIEANSSDVYICGLVMETYSRGELVNSISYKAKKQKVYDIKSLFQDLQINYPQICICGPWCKLYKSQLIKKNNIRFQRDLSLGEDTYFNLDVFGKAKQVLMTDDAFYHYIRENSESLFSKFEPNTYEIHVRVYDKMRSLMECSGCSIESRQRFENMYFSMLLGGIHSYYRFADKTTKEQRKDQIRKVANNEFVKKYNFKIILNSKVRVQLLLLKIKAYNLMDLIYERHYRGRTNG